MATNFETGDRVCERGYPHIVGTVERESPAGIVEAVNGGAR